MNSKCKVSAAWVRRGLLCALAAWSTVLNAQEVDTVRVGSAALAGARLELGATRVEGYSRVGGVDTPTSTTTQRVRLSMQGNIEVFVIETDHLGDTGERTRSTIVLRAEDFGLVHHRVKAERDSAAVSANDRGLTGWVVLPHEPIKLLDLRLDRRVFSVEGQIPWLFPLLPLTDGYAAAIPHFSEWQGGEEWSTIRVVGSESVESGGRSRECWLVDGGELFPGYRITYWVEKRTRQILQAAARGSEGGPEYWSKLIDFEPAV